MRWWVGLAALAVAALLAAVVGGPLAWAAVAVAAVGVVGAWPQLGVVAALLAGAGFCVDRLDEGAGLDARVVPLAAGLLLLAELVAWSAEARTAQPPGVPPSTRLLVLGATVLGAGGATSIVAAVVVAPLGDDLVFAALAAAGLVLVATLGVGLARTVSSR